MRPQSSSLTKAASGLSAAPALVLDACGTTIHVGIFSHGKWLYKTESVGEALQLVFDQTQATLHATGIRLDEIGQFIYAAGPGSTLGIRVCCMAISAWATIATRDVAIFRYNSLYLAARLFRDLNPADSETIFATAIRKGFYLTTLANTDKPDFQLLSSEDLEEKVAGHHVLVQMGGRFDANPPQMAYTPFPYQIDRLPKISAQLPSILEQTLSPQPYTFGTMEYKKWQGERHR